MRRALAILITAAMLFGFSGCGQSKKPAAETKPSAPAWTLTIEGVSDKAIEYSSEEFNKLGTVEAEPQMKNKDTSELKGKWTGVPLLKLLESLGVKEYSYVAVEGKDGSSKELTPDLVEKEATMLGIKVDGKELDSESGPVQLAVDGKGSNWWIKSVTKITVGK